MEATINYLGVDLEIGFDYTPEEPMVANYGDGSGFDGVGEEYSIYSIKVMVDTDIIDLFDNNPTLDGIERALRKEKDDYCPI